MNEGKLFLILMLLFILIMQYTVIKNYSIHPIKSNTVIDILKTSVKKYGDKPMLKVRTNNKWSNITYQQLYDNSLIMAKSLFAGEFQGHYITVVGDNEPFVIYTLLGAMMAGCITTVIPSSSSGKYISQIIDNNKSSLLILADVYKIASIDYTNQIKLVLYIQGEQGDPSLPADFSLNKNFQIYDWIRFSMLGLNIDNIDHTMNKNNLVSLMYDEYLNQTPIYNYQIIENIKNIIKDFIKSKNILNITSNEKYISYMPLTNLTNQLYNLYLPLATGGTVYITDNLAKYSSLIMNIQQIRPTILVASVNSWEKINDELGDSYGIPLLDEQQLHNFGLDKLKYAVVIGTPVYKSLIDNLQKFGIYLCNVYSGNFGIVSMPFPHDNGYIKRPRSNMKYKIINNIIYLTTEDGEIITGDFGTQKDELLVVEGNMKYLLDINGKKINPILIEKKIKEMSPVIDKVIITGIDYLIALITFKVEYSNNEPTVMLTKKTRYILRDHGIKINTTLEVEQNKQCVAYLNNILQTINVNSKNKIKKWIFLPNGITDLDINDKPNREDIKQKYSHS